MVHRILLIPILLLVPPAARAGERDPLEEARELLATVSTHVAASLEVDPGKALQLHILDEEAAHIAVREDLRKEIGRLYPGVTEGQHRALLESATEVQVRSAVARYSVTLKAILLFPESFRRRAASLSLSEDHATRLLRAILAHEAVHAFDDRRFGLAKLNAAAPDREALRALAMVVEGRACHFGGIAAEKLGNPAGERGAPPPAGDGIRENIHRLVYQSGEAFVAAIVRRGGVALADRALSDPPKLTHYVCQPDRWPEGRVDPRPRKALEKAFPEAVPEPLSELELRARYAAADSKEGSDELFAAYRGGVRTLVLGTNASVLAFADEGAAERFLLRSRRDVPAEREGSLVLRAAGPKAEDVVKRLAKALGR